MGGKRKRYLQFLAVSLLASSLVTFAPLIGDHSKTALAAQTTQTNKTALRMNSPVDDNKPATTNVTPLVANTQSEKRYSVYQVKGNQQIQLNSFQNLNDAILLAKGTINTQVIDEVTHAVLWNNALPAGSAASTTFVEPPKPGANPKFDDALAFALDWEGGYSNNPNDHGGSTYKGITQTEYASYRIAKGLPDQDVRNVTTEELRDIYYNGYWLPVHGNDMPYPIAIALFDSGVNCGPGTAIDFLQKSLGMAGGSSWTQIREALSTNHSPEISLNIVDYRDQYYKDIVNNDSTQTVFLQGWLNRDNSLTYKLSQWILQNHFYLDEAKWFLGKNNLFNAAYYAVQSVTSGVISPQDAVSLGDGLSQNDRLAFYQDLISNNATAEIKSEVKNRYLDQGKSVLAQNDYDRAASYAMQAFQLGASAQEVVGLADSLNKDAQTNYWTALLHSGQDLPPAIDAEFMRRQTVPVTGITLGNKSLRLTLQTRSVTLGADLSPANATDQKVNWKTDNPNVVQVDANGVITPVGVGTATITAITDDGGKTDTCSITVVPNTPAPTTTSAATITLDRTSLNLKVSDAVQKLNAVLSPVGANDQAINWTTDHPDVVKVDSNGVVTPVGVGTANVSATLGGSRNAATCTVTVVAAN